MPSNVVHQLLHRRKHNKRKRSPSPAATGNVNPRASTSTLTSTTCSRHGRRRRQMEYYKQCFRQTTAATATAKSHDDATSTRSTPTTTISQPFPKTYTYFVNHLWQHCLPLLLLWGPLSVQLEELATRRKSIQHRDLLLEQQCQQLHQQREEVTAKYQKLKERFHRFTQSVSANMVPKNKEHQPHRSQPQPKQPQRPKQEQRGQPEDVPMTISLAHRNPHRNSSHYREGHEELSELQAPSQHWHPRAATSAVQQPHPNISSLASRTAAATAAATAATTAAAAAYEQLHVPAQSDEEPPTCQPCQQEPLQDSNNVHQTPASRHSLLSTSRTTTRHPQSAFSPTPTPTTSSRVAAHSAFARRHPPSSIEYMEDHDSETVLPPAAASRRVTASPHRILQTLPRVRQSHPPRPDAVASSFSSSSLVPGQDQQKQPQPKPQQDYMMDSQTIIPEPTTKKKVKPTPQRNRTSSYKNVPAPPPVVPDYVASAAGGPQRQRLQDSSRSTVIPPPAPAATAAFRSSSSSSSTRKEPAAASARTQAPSSSSTPPRPASSNNERHSKKSNTSTTTTTTTTSAEQQGWISNRSVRDFVRQPGGATTKPTPTAVTTAPRNPTPKPPEAKRAPVVSHRSSSSTKPGAAAAAAAAMPSMDDPPSFRYQEVVRKKAEREALNTYECEECGKFMDALLQDDVDGVFERHELMCASRHRARHTPPETPEDYWELSFIDERDKRNETSRK